jgi:bacteriocin biosynthesis cyclodehydratase domain-containing protein
MSPPRRPCLALPFTVLTGRDTVRLVAGEDFRYTLTGPGLEQWLPGLLVALDGSCLLEDALGRVPDAQREPARELVERLYGERVLVEGPAEAAHPAGRYRLAPEGSAAWRAGLEGRPDDGTASAVLMVLCQDRLDYDEALRFNRRCLAGTAPWLWATTGPMGRGYVSPVFLPDAGPCLACLLSHFRRLSPAPEFYDALAEHARAGLPIRPVPFPPPAVAVVQQLVRWKADLLAEPETPAALYRLHVVEVASLEVTSHRVFADPECPECRGRR